MISTHQNATMHNNIMPFAGGGPNQPPPHYQLHYTHPQQVQVTNNHTHNTQPSPYNTHPSQMQHNNHTHMHQLQSNKRIKHQSKPTNVQANIQPMVEYHLAQAEHLLKQQPVTNATTYNVNGTHNNVTQQVQNVASNTYNVAGSLQPNKSTVTTSTTSTSNSAQQQLNTTNHSHSNEFTDNMYNNNNNNNNNNINELHLIATIIKGIYSKSTSIERQDNQHPAKVFETIDKFPQPHGIRPIGIFDIHQKIANSNQNNYKYLWEVYYDFAYIYKIFFCS